MKLKLAAGLIAVVGAALASPALAARVPADYLFAGDINLGAPGWWDYASFDPNSGRLYVAQVNTIAVIDTVTGKRVGSVGPLDDAHGAVAVPALGKGFATSGGDGVLAVFDLANLRITARITVGRDADAVIYDPATHALLVAVGDAKQLVVVDPRSGTVARKIDLPGAPEFPAVDGRGKVFVNLASTSQLARIDIASGRTEAVWALPGCHAPHGLAYDHRSGRLFSGCSNKVLVAVDPASGRILATLPIGPFSDAVAVDEARRRVFAPNGDGTLTVISEGQRDRYAVLRTLPTFFGAKSMAIDPRTGTLFVSHGDMAIKGGLANPVELRFGWDGTKVAVFSPND
jgi:hypothetical protein